MTTAEISKLLGVIGDMPYSEVISALNKGMGKDMGGSPSGGEKTEEFDPIHPPSNVKWNEDERCYIGTDGKRYNTDGEELIKPDVLDNFEDIKRRRARYNPNGESSKTYY